MTTFEEVGDGSSRAAEVVGDDGVGIEVAGGAVDEDERRAGPLLRIEIRVVVTRRHDDDPVDAPVAKRLDQVALALRVLVAAAREDEYAPLARRVLDGTVEPGGERVRDVLEHEADRLGLAPEPAEHRRVRVAAVVELLDREADLGRELGPDAGLAVHDARDRLQPDAGERGDVEHRRPPQGLRGF
jgi:hypothetical protein